MSTEQREQRSNDSPRHSQPIQRTNLGTDDTECWLCHAPVVKRHCKIICTVCGFMRDCSDP